jgi:cytochrome c7-like protein
MSEKRKRIQTIAVLLFLAFGIAAGFLAHGAAAQKKRTQRARSRKTSPKPEIDYAKFSHTTHVVSQKLACNSCHKVPAKNWNVVRKGDAAFQDVTDFPQHSSCLNCHRTQFFARERPAPVICSNCHIAVTPRDTARWLFPSLGDITDPKLKRRESISEFGVAFPHDKHIDVVGMIMITPSPFGRRLGEGLSAHRPSPPTPLAAGAGRSSVLFVAAAFQTKPAGPPKSCPVCHETYQPQGKSSDEYVVKLPKDIGDNFWLKKGAFKTIPNSHTICFQCHNADLGILPEPKNCETCHKLTRPQPLQTDFEARVASAMGADAVMLARWRRRQSAGAFRHEGGMHPDLSCLDCHNVATSTFSTVDPKTMKVAVKSCGGADGCHITQTLDDGGALNYEIDSRRKNPGFVCTKCHLTLGKEALPENHAQAIPTPKPKAKTS